MSTGAMLIDVARIILDVLILAFILYQLYKLIVKTNAEQLVKAAVVIALIYTIASFFKLSTLLWLLGMAGPALLIGFAIVFQPELRKIFFKLGQNEWISPINKAVHSDVDSVLTAAEQLGHMKKGMLVVFQRRNRLMELIGTGQELDAKLSSNLLLTIFAYETAMHDGACIVKGDRIIAAGCFLPLSENYDIRKTFGTRHRAALGTAEKYDAVVLIVSEETGAISLAYDSQLYYDLDRTQLKQILGRQLDIKWESTVEE